MTTEQFAQHLTTQPWTLAYIHNLTTLNTTATIVDNFIVSAFTWGNSPEGDDFWYSISTQMCYNCDDTVIPISDLISAIYTYFPDNPELFI